MKRVLLALAVLVVCAASARAADWAYSCAEMNCDPSTEHCVESFYNIDMSIDESIWQCADGPEPWWTANELLKYHTNAVYPAITFGVGALWYIAGYVTLAGLLLLRVRP